MHFERIWDSGLAEAAYIIGCAAAEQAVVIDPLTDWDRVLERLDELGFELSTVLETHIHADFLSGARDLAKSTGARLAISGETVEGWEYSGLEKHDVIHLMDGDAIELGNVTLEALHTPGHTPEHLSYLVTDRARSSDPSILLSGDFLFVGDVGRPDLLEAAGEEGSGEDLGRQLFESLKEKLLPLPDDVVVWPNHGAGSACGKSLGAVPMSTVGYEKRNAWWRDYVREDDVEGFVAELLEGQPAAPRYFKRMKVLNRDGSASVRLQPPSRLGAADVASLDDPLPIDLQGPREFARGHAEGAVNMPSLENLSDHAGAALPYDKDALLVCDPEVVEEAWRKLIRVGHTVVGWVPSAEWTDDEISSRFLEPDEAREAIESGAVPIDVRAVDEWDDGHLEGAIHLPYTSILDREDALEKGRNYVAYCGSGIRASIAVSLLRRQGYDVVNGGGYAELANT